MTTYNKVLGIDIDNNLTWNNHFNFLSKQLSPYHRVISYNAYIKPHLDYCSLTWSNTSKLNTKKIMQTDTETGI